MHSILSDLNLKSLHWESTADEIKQNHNTLGNTTIKETEKKKQNIFNLIIFGLVVVFSPVLLSANKSQYKKTS